MSDNESWADTHWLWHYKDHTVEVRLRDVAGQENADGNEYALMMEAANEITRLKERLEELKRENERLDGEYELTKHNFNDYVEDAIAEKESLRRENKSLTAKCESLERVAHKALSGDEWVSVEDRLPEEDQIVLLCNVERFMNCHFDLNWYGAGYLNSFNSWHVIGEGRGLCLDAVTHWKPIKPPTEEG